ncbi:MAG: hypothetical protein ACYCO5_14330 [Acidobacteriaceae bacterium]
MKLAGAFSLALVLGSLTLPAQSSGRHDTQPAVATVVPGSSNCPVDIRAQKNLGAGQLQTLPAGSDRNPGLGQNLHLTLTNSTFAQIIGVRITAYGLNSKGQVTPARTTADDSSAIKKTLDLKLKVEPKSNASTDILLTGFTSVAYINVDSIRYADGSTWTPSAAHTCHVVPDAAMLISRR